MITRHTVSVIILDQRIVMNSLFMAPLWLGGIVINVGILTNQI